MDKIEQLYKLYIEKGLITSETSLEDFANANKDIQGKLYELGKTEGLFATTGLNDFQSAWAPAPAKTLDPADVDPTVESKNGTGSISTDGSSDASNNNGSITFDDPGDYDFDNPEGAKNSGRRFVQLKKGGRIFEEDYLQDVKDNPRDKYNQLKPDTFEKYVLRMGWNTKNIGIEGVKKPKAKTSSFKVAKKVLADLKENYGNTEVQNQENRTEANSLFVPYANRPKVLRRLDKFDEGRWEVLENEDYDTFVNIASKRLKIKEVPGENPFGSKEKEVLALANKLYVADKQRTNYADNIEKYAREHESSIKETSVGADLDYIKKIASKVIKGNTAEIKANQAKAEIMVDTIVLMKDEIVALRSKTYANNDELRVAQARDKYLLENIIVANQKYEEYFQNNIQSLVYENAENEAIIDITKRSYKNTAILGANVAATVGETIGGILNVPEWLVVSAESIVTGNSPEKTATAMSGYLDFGGDVMQEAGQSFRNSVAKPLDVGDIDSWSDFAYWGTDMVGNQALNTVLMVAVPGASLGIMASSAAGGKYSDMMGSIENGEAVYSGWQMFAAPAIVGTLEYATEKVSLGQLKGIKSVFKKNSSVQKAAKEYINEKILNKNYFVDTFGEGFAEGINQLGGNAVDMFLLDNKDVHIWDGVPNAAASGAFMSGAIYKAPVIGARILSPFAKQDMKPRLFANVQMLNKIELELAKPGLSDSVKKSLKESSAKIQQANTDIITEQLDNVDSLTDDQKTELISIDKRKEQLRVEWNEMNDDKTVSPDIKAELLKTKNEEYDKLNREKNTILAKVGADQDILKVEALLNQMLGNSEVKVFETTDKSTSNEQLKAFLIEHGKSEAYAEANKSNYGAFVPDINDPTKEYLVINKDSALEDKVVTTGQHEFLHKVLKQAFASDPELATTMGSLLLKEITTNPALNSPKLKGRISQYADMLADPDQDFNEADFFEEVLTTFSEALTNKEITINENVVTKIADIIRRAANSLGIRKLKFKKSKHVINFIKDYNKDFSKGKLSKQLQKFSEGNNISTKTFPSLKSPVSTLQNELDNLDDADFDYDTTRFNAAKSNLEFKIRAAKKKEASKPKKKTEFDIGPDSTMGKINALIPKEIKTQEQFKAATGRKGAVDPISKGIDEALKPNGIISNMLITRGMTTKERELALESISKRWRNYNPAAPRKTDSKVPITFGEWVMSNANFGTKDAKKDIVTAEQIRKNQTDLDNKQAQSIANEESSGPTADNRKKYASLISNTKMIPSFVINEIKTKLVDITSKLTSKLSTRPKGANAQTTPLIAEIKKAIGNVVKDPKALPKQLIDRMGNPKDGSYQTYLIDNKKSILENMTTTYLQTAIPAAVEKSVGGTYVLDNDGKRKKDSNGNDIFKPNFVPYSEWKGKKIDREKVSTNKKGGTSGNEIVRRAIQVENKEGKFEDSISNEDFVANFVGSDGKVIRGKRESLGKALAEEAGFEVLTKELANENSDIRKAFKENQTALKEVLVDNFVEQISRDAERGTVKFSFKTRMSPIEAFKFQSNADLFSDGIIGLKTLSKDNIKKIFLTTFDPNDFRPEIIDGIAETFSKRLKPVSNAFELVPIPIFKQILIEISNQTDEALALQKLVGSVMNASEVYRDKSTVMLARGATIENMQMLVEEHGVDEALQLIVAFGSSTFSSQGAIGLFKFDLKSQKLVKGLRRDGRPITKAGADLFSGAEDLLQSLYNSLDLGGKKIEKIENNKISFTDGTSVARKYSPVTSVTQGMLNEGYVPDMVNYKAAQRFVTSFFENFAKQNLDPNVALALLSTFNNGSSNALRAAARVWGKSTTMPYKTIKVNGKRVYIFEHAIPARVVLTYLYEYHVNGNKSININALWEDYRVTIIPIAEMDNVLTSAGFSSITTSSYVPGETPWYNRYYNLFTRGRMPYAMVSYDGKETVGESYEQYFNEKTKKLLVEASRVNEVKEKIIEQKAINNARSIKWSKSPKKIRVFDFDDTLAQTKSNVLYTMPDGTTGKIDAATFAKDAGKMEAEGVVWDFSEFSKVMNGKKGPLFEVAKIIADKRGTEDVFVLTARPADAAGPIQEFLASMGLNIPIENITGLGNGAPKAKADWMISKVAEGYNDFYFADDHTGNVNAVKDVLDTFDVKGKVQLAKVKFSKSLDPEFNSMIERNKGVGANKEFSRVVAKRRGASKGKYKAFITSSADDFRGLTSYTFAGKGKQGEADQAFFEDALLTPYFRGVNALESARVVIKSDFKQLGKIFKPEVKKLSKLTPDGDFTYDQALRVYMWNKQGTEIPGISKRDQAKLVKLIEEDAGLQAFSEAAVLATKKDGWIDPGEYWDAKTMLSDLNDLTETSNRAEYIAEFIENADIIFSEKNLNKIEAVYGTKHREALEDALYAMKNGTNRLSGSNKITNKWNNWVNNSIGTIMFFNRRSALMQTLSIANFLNWSDNNPLKAGLAFANQPQYWKDFVMIFNSDKLKQRRGGLKSDVQEAEIANAAKGAKNKPQAIISYLLKKGFLPTQIADSFAISMGGASMYRNRVNTYKNQGFDLKTAEEKAFLDFSKISDETQQSGDPALVSQQQRSVAGRVILSFQNTTMQYTRLMKKSAQDLINGRGDPKTHISKIIYYGAVQNFIFNALSTSLFALIPGFGDEDEEEIDEKELDKKSTRVLHGMFDSVAKGTGIYGAVVVTLKNAYRAYTKEKEKGFMGQPGWQTSSEMLNIAPAIGSKFKKVKSAIDVMEKYDKDIIEKHPWDVAIGGRFNPSSSYTVIGDLSSALLNIPLDRALVEARGISEMLDDRNTIFQRVALGLGWRTWNVGAKNEEFDLIKSAAKKEEKKKKSNSKKARTTSRTSTRN
jgi:hypothetical protein